VRRAAHYRQPFHYPGRLRIISLVHLQVAEMEFKDLPWQQCDPVAHFKWQRNLYKDSAARNENHYSHKRSKEKRQARNAFPECSRVLTYASPHNFYSTGKVSHDRSIYSIADDRKE
jgi:hypothetical protein